MDQSRDSQRGQVLVIFALVLVVLLGFAAFALDGGNIYADRRSAQAAADTAALSGALAIVEGYAAWQVADVAQYRASENGYTHNPPDTSVVVNWPPVAPHPYAGDPGYVQVIITHRLDTIFAHLFYEGPFVQSVEAVAHARVNEDLLPGYSVYADNDSACPGVEFDGNPDTTVTGGGSILANSTQSCSCAASGAAGVSRGTGSVNVIDPLGRAGIFSAGCWKEMGSTFVSVPPPQGGVSQETVNLPPVPDCSALPDHTGEGDKVYNGVGTISPGRYDSIHATSAHAVLTMQPGIYCLSGDLAGVSPRQAFQIDADAAVLGSDVMIYLGPTAGGFRAAGSGTTTLAAGDPSGAVVPALIDASGEDWRGMLIYVDPSNTSDVHLSGGSNTSFTGTIFALGSHCTVQGGGGVLAMNTQLLCDSVRITGNGDVHIDYNPARFYQREDGIDLFH